MGIAAGEGDHSWAYVYGGGWTPVDDSNNYSTAAGVLFANIVRKLNGPDFVIGSRVVGTAPGYSLADVTPSGGGVPGSGVYSGGPPPAGDYDWGPVLRRASHWLGVHGRRAQFHARETEALIAATTYVTTTEPRG
jgi:hypothetical protein